jgi:chemotaxis signal transduction protein
MLFITFKAGGGRFALPGREVERITPLVSLAPLPGAPPYVAGLMNLAGESLPVADLTALITGKPSRPWNSTRIVVAAPGQGRKAGFLAERLLKAVHLDPAAIAPPGAPAAPYLRGVATLEGELIEIIDLARTVPPELLLSLARAGEAP